MSWSSRRRVIYISIFLGIFLVVGFGIFYLFIYQAPTCFDEIQNQNEQGIDCGGVCEKVCDFETIRPVVLWTKFFKVADGIYNVVAYVENPNTQVVAINVPYIFKIYDKDNILIGSRRGRTNLPSKTFIPIFERTISTKNREPLRAPVFDFTGDFNWVKEAKAQPDLFIKNKVLEEKDGGTRLSVVVENKTSETVKDIEVTGFIYNKEGNVIAVSQTVINSLSKNSSKKVIFTWSNPLLSQSNKIKVIALVKNSF